MMLANLQLNYLVNMGKKWRAEHLLTLVHRVNIWPRAQHRVQHAQPENIALAEHTHTTQEMHKV